MFKNEKGNIEMSRDVATELLQCLCDLFVVSATTENESAKEKIFGTTNADRQDSLGINTLSLMKYLQGAILEDKTISDK